MKDVWVYESSGVAQKLGHNLQDIHLRRMIEHMRFGFLTPTEWGGFLLGFAVGFYVSTNGWLLEHSWSTHELHAMNEKMSNDFLNGKWKWILYVIKKPI